MEDKEVGKLWAELQVGGKDLLGQIYKGTVTNLIRKLVEQRAKAYMLCDMTIAQLKEDQHYSNMALRDFGIDPARWIENEPS